MYESLKKFDNTKFEWVWFWNEGTLFDVRDLHYEGVKLISNLKMTPKAIFHSFVWLKGRKMSLCVTPWNQRKEKIFDQNQLGDGCVENLVHQDAWMQFIGQGKGKKRHSNSLKSW
jgi:hypothetical protein